MLRKRCIEPGCTAPINALNMAAANDVLSRGVLPVRQARLIDVRDTAAANDVLNRGVLLVQKARLINA